MSKKLCNICGKPEGEHNDGLFCCPKCGSKNVWKGDISGECKDCEYIGYVDKWNDRAEAYKEKAFEQAVQDIFEMQYKLYFDNGFGFYNSTRVLGMSEIRERLISGVQ